MFNVSEVTHNVKAMRMICTAILSDVGDASDSSISQGQKTEINIVYLNTTFDAPTRRPTQRSRQGRSVDSDIYISDTDICNQLAL